MCFSNGVWQPWEVKVARVGGDNVLSIWQADGERLECWVPIDDMYTIYQEMRGGTGVKDGVVLLPHGGRLGFVSGRAWRYALGDVVAVSSSDEGDVVVLSWSLSCLQETLKAMMVASSSSSSSSYNVVWRAA